jgi:hypothetical protein
VLIIPLSAIIIITGFFIYYAFLIETSLIKTEQVKVRTGKIVGKYMIMHLSDFHLFRNMSRSRFNKIREVLRKWSDNAGLDFIFITGDFIDDNSGIALIKDMLSGLKAHYGIFAVLGNHDYFQYNFFHIFYPGCFFNKKKPTDLVMLKEALVDSGIRLLIDESAIINTGINKIRILGIDSKSIKRRKPPVFSYNEDEFIIALSHYPEAVKFYEGIADIMLSGHTHGGQITLFGLPVIVKSGIERKNARGVSIHNLSMLFVSKGLGVSRYFPFRFFAKPDLNIIEIKGDHYEDN